MTEILPLFLTLVLSAAGAGEPATVQGEESVLVTYDLRAVMPRWDASPNWSQSLAIPPAADPHQERSSIDRSLEYSELASFELLDLLTQILGEELRREGRELMVEGHSLIALAPPALHQQLRAILDGLASVLGGTVSVRVDLLSMGEDTALPPAGVVSDDEAAELIRAVSEGGASHESYQLELSAGRTARLDSYRRVPFLFDYDVEIAQGMMIFDPVVSETREGVRLAMRGMAVPDGLALSTVFMRSELLGEIELQKLNMRGALNQADKGSVKFLDGPEGVQSPEALVRGLSFDSFLPDGKALVLTMEASLASANLREVLVVRRLGGGMSSYFSRAIPGTNRTLVALNAELFRAPRLSADASPWRDDDGTLLPSVTANFEGQLSTFLLEWLKARFSIWRRFGPWILIVTDPAWDRDAAAQLEGLLQAVRPRTRLHNASIELSSSSKGAEVPVRVRLPLLEGSSVGVLVARGKTAVTGFDVEVAQGAAVPDPHVGTIFDGLAMSVVFDGSTCETRGMAQIFDAPASRIDPGYAMIGSITLPEPRILRFDERLRLPEGGGSLRIGGTRDSGEGASLSLEIRFSSLTR